MLNKVTSQSYTFDCTVNISARDADTIRTVYNKCGLVIAHRVVGIMFPFLNLRGAATLIESLKDG